MSDEIQRGLWKMYLAGVETRQGKVHPAWIKELRSAFYAGFLAAKISPETKGEPRGNV